MPTAVFISHRHHDALIADVLNEHLQRWQLNKDEVFQSSRAESGARVGSQLNKELLRALGEVRLVLLVYTVADADWSYCMWECGVATDPRQNDTPTRIVVFRLTEDVPKVLQDLVSVRATLQADVKRFVQQFFREPGWVRQGHFNLNPSDKVLESYAYDLYTDLQTVLPKSTTEERMRWDFFTLRFDHSSIRKIAEAHQENKMVSNDTLTFIQKNGRILFDFGQALMHFGYNSGVRDITLFDLVERWTEEVTSESTTPRDWIKELAEELLRAIRDKPAKPNWAVLVSRLFPGWWFYPIVNHQRIHGDGSMEFDIYMYRLPGALPATVDLIRDR